MHAAESVSHRKLFVNASAEQYFVQHSVPKSLQLRDQ